MDWGDSVYTVLPIPDEIYAQLLAQKAKRVDIELNDCPFNMALTKAPVIDQVFVYAGKRVLSQAGIEPGDLIDVRVRMSDPNSVDVPSDVSLAILNAGLTAEWDALSAGKKRGLLHTVETAKRAATRAARIEKLMSVLHD